VKGQRRVPPGRPKRGKAALTLCLPSSRPRKKGWGKKKRREREKKGKDEILICPFFFTLAARNNKTMTLLNAPGPPG